MGKTPEQFIIKNMKWFTLIFLLLFLFKTVQSCNRKMSLNIGSKQYIEQIDSLVKENGDLKNELRLKDASKSGYEQSAISQIERVTLENKQFVAKEQIWIDEKRELLVRIRSQENEIKKLQKEKEELYNKFLEK